MKEKNLEGAKSSLDHKNIILQLIYAAQNMQLRGNVMINFSSSMALHFVEFLIAFHKF